VNQCLKLRKREAGSNLADVGRCAVRDDLPGGWVVNSEAVWFQRWGGHVEGLRRRRGDAAGVELGASLADRCLVNVGTIRGCRAVSSQDAVGAGSVADRGPRGGAGAS
jgi:hypothetical protein